VDIVVNNAGTVPRGPLEDQTFETFMHTLAVHAGGVFNVTRAAWPHMEAQGYGRVVNICSSEGILAGSPGFAAYGAAKGAMLGVTRSLAAEGEPLGIAVNGVLPAAMTRGNASVSHGYKREETVDKQPRHVAPAVCWLSHESCGVTGHFYDVSAGSMRSVYISAGEGHQSERPDDFSIEEVRDNWDTIERREPAIVPYNWAELNAFRVDLYRRRVSLG
jgi:NAD(P)-dependent dehydrogenase (short-subunit alcohol dehydrogenase family)